MSAAKQMDALLDRARRASERVMTERDDARGLAIATIRALEQRVQEAIAGDVLRGLKDIAQPVGVLRAARVGGSLRWGIDERLEWRRTSLCLHQDGRLVMAMIDGPRLVVRDAEDDDLRIEHLEPVTACVRDALTRHAEHSERTADSYARVVALSARLASAVG